MKKGLKGSMTVFIAIVTSVLMIFMAVSVDIAKIYYFDNIMTHSVQSAARSVLAGYDVHLVGEYGLYACRYNENYTPADIFSSYYRSNIKTSAPSVNLTPYGPLSQNEIIKKQVLDFMAVKGIIMSGENIIAKLKAGGILKGLGFAKAEKSVREKRQEIKDGVEQTNKTIKEAKATDKKSKKGLKDYVKILKNLSSVAKALKDPMEEYKKLKSDADKEAEMVEAEPSATEFENLPGILERLEKDTEEEIKKVDILISMLEELDEKIEASQMIITQLNNDISNYMSSISMLNQNIALLNSQPKITPAIAEKILLCQQQINEINNTINQKKTLLEQQTALLNTAIAESDRLFAEFEAAKLEEIIVPEPELPPERDPDEKTLIDSLKEKVYSFAGIKSIDAAGLLENLETNGLFEGISDKNLSEAVNGEDSAENNNDQVLSIGDTLKSFIEKGADMLGSAYDNYLITLYCLDRFTYLTSKTHRTHYFDKGEAEYIIWGNTNQLTNITINAGTIFLIRLTINTLDLFLKSKIPHPVARLIYALTDGLILSLKDMTKILTGKSVALTPSFKAFQVNYEDHLILLLFIQSKEKKLNALKQLIQINMMQIYADFNINYTYTGIQAEVTDRSKVMMLSYFQKETGGEKKDGYYLYKKLVMEVGG